MRKLFILFFALAFSGAVRADTMYYVGQITSGLFSAKAAACNHYNSYSLSTSNAHYYVFKEISPSNMCVWLRSTQPGQFPIESNAVVAVGSISSVEVSACPVGQIHKEGAYPAACEAEPIKCNTPAGATVTWTRFEGHGSATSTTSGNKTIPSVSSSCGISDVPDIKECFSVKTSDGGKDYFCTYTATSNGTAAPAGTAPDAGAKPPDATSDTKTTSADSTGKCPGGTVQAGVDSSGIPICVGTGTNPNTSTSTSTSTTPTTTTTNADGSTTAVSSTSTTNSDGSVTTVTTTVVTAPDGTTKVTRTSSTSNGSNGGSGKDDATKDFCSAHPQLTVCQNSSVAGTCGQISCTGDAIQCATLRAAAAMQCAQQQDIDALKVSPQKALGEQILSGADPMSGQISDTLKGGEVDMSRVSFDQSGFLGGGTCLSNRSFTVLGHVVQVDFTTVCNNIAPLRTVMMAVALIMAYLIVGRSVVGS